MQPGREPIAARDSWLQPLLRPRSVAIVGASPRQFSAGFNVVDNLIACRFPGPIYPVNPKYTEIAGLRCYPSISEIGAPIDAVFIAIPAEFGPDTLREALDAGARAALVNGSNYADAGEAGQMRQHELAALARNAGIPLCGPNNLGLINVVDRVPLWTSSPLPGLHPGSVAVVSQSGSVALTLSEDVLGLGLAYVVTAGNEAVCTVADYVEALVEDDRVSIILLFLETIRDVPRFAAAADLARIKGKRIIATKIGRSALARAAVAAHSGALSGEDAVCDAFFRRHGIVRAADPDEMIQLARLFLAYPAPRPDTHPVFITLSGGEGAALADFAAEAGLPIAELGAPLRGSLAPLFPPNAPPRNPMDAWGFGWDPAQFAKILDVLIADPVVNPIAFVLDIPAGGGVDGRMARDMARLCGERASGSQQFMFVANSALSGVFADVEQACRLHGFPILLGARNGVRVLKAWYDAAPLSEGKPTGSRAAVEPTPLLPDQVRPALERDGILRFVAAEIADSAEHAVALAHRCGYPVVLKGIAADVEHKTELGLVKLNLRTDEAVREAFSDLARKLAKRRDGGAARIEVQPMVEGGLELLVAARRDPQFGPLVIVGAGGRLVELLGDSALRLGPVDVQDAERMLMETRLGRLLQGYRDGRAYDIAAAVKAIAGLSQFIEFATAEDSAVRSVEINPLIVLPEGQGAVAVDLLVE